MHILEDHIIPWISKWGHGMAFHGEQGIEGMHAEFNRLDVAHSAIKRPLDRLMSVVRMHRTKTDPSIQKHIVPVKNRKVFQVL